MKLRLAGTLVLVLGVAVLASTSAYAGNGQNNGNGQVGAGGQSCDDQASNCQPGDDETETGD